MKKLNETDVKKRGVMIQGDVVICPGLGGKNPQGVVKKDGVIAEGEVTGHAHRVNPEQIDVVVNPTLPAVMWLKSLGVNVEAKVTHEEHEDIKLKSTPGKSDVSWVQQEYSWTEGLRRVAD